VVGLSERLGTVGESHVELRNTIKAMALGCLIGVSKEGRKRHTVCLLGQKHCQNSTQ
jgi:hypothetical protein